MSPFVSRARAEGLALRLDAAPTTGAAPGSAPALAQSLRDVGAALAPRLAPRPEFRAALRTRLVAVASVQAVTSVTAAAPARTAPAPAWLTGRRARQGAGVAVGALASVVAVSGVAVASSASLPGDPFYGVKRTTEALQLRVADSDMEQGGRHLEFAATRLREVRGLMLGRSALDDATADASTAPAAAPSGAVAERVRGALADMDAETREGSRLMTEAFRSSQAPGPLLALARFTSRQTARLEGLMPVLPSQAQDRARASLAVLAGVSQETEQLLGLGVCGPACDPMTTSGGVGPAAGATPSPSPAPTASTTTGEPEQSPAAPAAADPEPSRPAEPAAARPTARSSSRPRPSSDGVLRPQDRSPVPLPQPSRSALPLPGLPDPSRPLEQLLPPRELGLTPVPKASRSR